MEVTLKEKETDIQMDRRISKPIEWRGEERETDTQVTRERSGKRRNKWKNKSTEVRRRHILVGS